MPRPTQMIMINLPRISAPPMGMAMALTVYIFQL